MDRDSIVKDAAAPLRGRIPTGATTRKSVATLLNSTHFADQAQDDDFDGGVELGSYGDWP